jgi:RNA polymerase sigma-70 factor, ECF subfamily
VDDDLQRQLPPLLPRLWRFALRLTRHAADAEDLLQRSCLRALERRAQWQPGSALLSWVFAIMHSIWLNELRSAQRRRESALDWGDEFAETAAPLSLADPEHAMMCRQVVAAVQALPEAQRLVMLLVAVEGLSYREAADVLGVPIGTVMSRLARARVAVGQRFMPDAVVPLAGREESR